ncbi:MAG: hypothetical protein SGI94_09490 [Saprospiraceae bacterium]|mgnify:CR=1 FL=1|nr:hypothetical protein [Saprospiraceae bacterium]
MSQHELQPDDFQTIAIFIIHHSPALFLGKNLINGQTDIEVGVEQFVAVRIDLELMGAVFLTVGFLLLLANVTASATTYTLIGSGNWSVSANWDGNGIPPNPLPSGDAVVINGSGTAGLDVSQILNSGSSLTINASKTLHLSNYITLFIDGMLTNNGDLIIIGASLQINNGATLNNNGSVYSRGGVTNNGTLNNNGTLHSQGGVTNNGTLHNFSALRITFYSSLWNNGTLNINSGSYLEIALYAILNNSGIINNNNGRYLSNNNSAVFHNYATLTNDGTLDNTTSSTLTNHSGGTLANNGTLKGTGTIVQNCAFTNSATAIIAPGGSPGTLTVTGNFDLSGGTYQCEINGTVQGSAYDLLAISGTATIGAASKLNLVFGYNAISGTTYDILTGGPVSGTFTDPANISFSGGNVTGIGVSYPDAKMLRVNALSLLSI